MRIDLVAGRGMGAVSAMFAAIDGGARLWEPSGIWKSRAVTRLYEWRPGLRIATFREPTGVPEATRSLVVTSSDRSFAVTES